VPEEEPDDEVVVPFIGTVPDQGVPDEAPDQGVPGCIPEVLTSLGKRHRS